MKKEPKEKTTKKRVEEGTKYGFLLIISAVGILIYSNTFDSPFQWDESDFLVRNPIVKNLRYFLEPSKAIDLDPDYYFFLKTRYVGYLTFALNYQIHGFHVWGYHLFNLAVHLLNGFLVYGFNLLSFRTPFMKESSLKQDSRLVALFSGLLFVSHPVQKPERAMKEFQMTLKIDPYHAKAHNNLGLIYTRQGRVEDAIQEFQDTLSTHPDDSNVHYNLGIAFGQGRRLDEAARAFQAALRLNPGDANARNNLGVIFGQQGRLEDAIREFEGALKIDPTHVNAQNNLRKAYGKAGKAIMEDPRK